MSKPEKDGQLIFFGEYAELESRMQLMGINRQARQDIIKIAEHAAALSAARPKDIIEAVLGVMQTHERNN